MSKVINTEFRNQRIELDGASYVKCRFFSCTIIYRGAAPTHLDGCEFTDCQWMFLDASLRTVGFMSALYTFAPQLIEKTFDDIRRGDFRKPSAAGRPADDPAADEDLIL